MRPRIKHELELLRSKYEGVLHSEANGIDWFFIAKYVLPEGWLLGNKPTKEVPIAFCLQANYPEGQPYGFLGPAGLMFNGVSPKNTGAPPQNPPFEGSWIHFSWSADGWAGSSDVNKGSNAISWTRSFLHRFKEGA
jgi:hypothetical protein